MYRGTFEDLRAAGKAAREHMKKHGFRHTDAEFDFWLRDIQGNAGMIYAVHALSEL